MITIVSYLLVTITALAMGVFSNVQERRITTTGTIIFTPELKAAVEIEFSIENAYKLSEGDAIKVTETVQTFKNYTEVEGGNPITQSNFSGGLLTKGKLIYENLVFDPGVKNAEEADITLTFKITNYSVKDEDMLVDFASEEGEDYLPEKTPENKMGYTVNFPQGAKTGMTNQIKIEKGESETITIILSISDISELLSELEFKFSLTFDFLPET